MIIPEQLDVVFSSNDRYHVDLNNETSFVCTMADTYASQIYDGPVVITPSLDQQELQTAGTLVRDNIIVEPIPSNYGLITWNGAVLTVS